MRVTQRTRRALAILVAAIVLLSATPARAEIDDQMFGTRLTKLKGTLTLYLRTKSDRYYQERYFELGKNDTVANAKSSKSKVVSVVAWNNSNQGTVGGMRIIGNKVGKATVSYKLNGKKHTVNVVVKKYVNPAKKLTFANKNYATKFKNKTQLITDLDKMQGKKLKVTPASGWKVKSISCNTVGSTGSKESLAGYNPTSKKLKNGGMVPKKGVISLYVVMEHKSTKARQVLSFWDSTWQNTVMAST